MLVIPASWPLAEVSFVPTAVDARTTRSSLFGENRKTLLSDLYSHIPKPASSYLLISAYREFLNSCFAVKKTFNIHVREKGEVRSPGFPDSAYPPNVYLQWRLRADPGHRIQLDFHTLILDEDCQQDFIRIYDSLAPIEHRVLTE